MKSSSELSKSVSLTNKNILTASTCQVPGHSFMEVSTAMMMKNKYVKEEKASAKGLDESSPADVGLCRRLS